MNALLMPRHSRSVAQAAAACLWAMSLGPWAGPSAAYPPAPHHVLYGLARDEYGTPFMSSLVQVLLLTPTGVRLSTPMTPGILPGVNYQLEVPMDAGLTADTYSPLALTPAAPFKLYVVIGTTTNLPIQMTGDFRQLGQPGKTTRLDVTLGVDANADGIPDAWEYAFLAALRSNLSLSDLQVNLDLAHDGLTLLEEFLLGNYPFNPGAFAGLRFVNLQAGSALLELTTMTGRSYMIQGSADLQQWTSLDFTIPAEGANGPSHTFYFAPDIRTLQVQVPANFDGTPPPGPAMGFFRLVLP